MITLVRILRFLIFLLLSHGASAEQGDPFYQEKLGKCFKDKDQFIRDVLGEQAANDQNLISTKKGSWNWITDQTATENYAWYLLEDRKGMACWRIFIPAANDVRLIRTSQRNLIRAIIAPKPDFPPKTIYLVDQKNTLAFKSYKCITSKSSKNKNEIIQVPCHKIYE